MTDTALSIQTSLHSGPYQCATNAVTGNRALLVSANAHADAGPHFASGAASAAAEHNLASGAVSAVCIEAASARAKPVAGMVKGHAEGLSGVATDSYRQQASHAQRVPNPIIALTVQLIT